MPVHTIQRGSEKLGFIAIDSTVAGRARGGLRLVTDLGEGELRAAARSMTLKYGLLGLPQGGAKAGILGDPDAPSAERRRQLSAFAGAAEPLLRTRQYIPDADLGTTADAVREMMQSIGARVGRREWRGNRSGEYTAWSVVASTSALFERLGRPLAGARVAIEGFGKVGSVLALLLRQRGAAIVAVSTSRGAIYDPEGLDVDRLLASAVERGSRLVESGPGLMDRSALLELPVDLLCPCARFHSIHAGNVQNVQAAAICAGANNPLSAEALAALEARGVHCLPDFVSNCGGVLGGTLEFAGVQPERIGDMIEGVVRDLVRPLFDRAHTAKMSVTAIAELEALARHDRVKQAAEHPHLMGRVAGVGLEAYRRGWFPPWLMARIAPAVVRRGLR